MLHEFYAPEPQVPLMYSPTPRHDGVYLCVPCDVQFDYSARQTHCPTCDADSRDDIAALYIDHDAEEADFVQAFDFGEGD